MFKWSMFNYEVCDENFTVIKNSRSCAIIKLPNEVYESLKESVIDENNPIFAELIKNRFITNDDESRSYSKEINYALKNPSNFVIVLAPTLSCNFKCSYCYESGIHNANELDEKNIIEELNSISEYIRSTDEIVSIKIILFGGEPTLVPIETLENIVTSLQASNVYFDFDVISNGFNITPDFLNWCRNSNIDNIQITLDGNQLFHDKYRVLHNGAVTFEKIFNNLERILDDDVSNSVIIRINCTVENIDSVGELLEELHKVYNDKIHKFKFSFGQLGYGVNEETNKSVATLAGKSEEFFFKFASLFKKARKRNFSIPTEYSVGDLCTFKRKNSIVISPNNVYKCMRSIGRSEDKIELNHFLIANMTVELYEECFDVGCKYIPYCHNGCLFSAKLEKKQKICRIKELDYINKTILSQEYL